MGRRRWQRRRSSHPVRRPHKRGSAARRDARQRQHASDGRPPPRPQRHGKRTKPRGLPKRVRQPARLSCPFAPGADLDAISLSDAPDRTEVGPARGRSFPKNKLASVGHEREQLFQRWWASHVLHLARKSPCFAMRSAFVIATPSNGGRPLPLLLLTSISRSTIFVTYPRPQFPSEKAKHPGRPLNSPTGHRMYPLGCCASSNSGEAPDWPREEGRVGDMISHRRPQRSAVQPRERDAIAARRSLL